MKTTLRIATIDDALTLADISRKTFEETWSFYYKEEVLQQFLLDNYSNDQIGKEILDPDVINYFAYVDDELAGFMKLSRRQTLADWITDKCLELVRIYVYLEFHDLKIGKLMMEKAIEMAHEEKMESIVLGVWENNHKAVRFYKQFGFEQIGSHPFAVGPQIDMDWIMRKKLV